MQKQEKRFASRPTLGMKSRSTGDENHPAQTRLPQGQRPPQRHQRAGTLANVAAALPPQKPPHPARRTSRRADSAGRDYQSRLRASTRAGPPRGGGAQGIVGLVVLPPPPPEQHFGGGEILFYVNNPPVPGGLPFSPLPSPRLLLREFENSRGAGA